MIYAFAKVHLHESVQTDLFIPDAALCIIQIRAQKSDSGT